MQRLKSASSLPKNRLRFLLGDAIPFTCIRYGNIEKYNKGIAIGKVRCNLSKQASSGVELGKQIRILLSFIQ